MAEATPPPHPPPPPNFSTTSSHSQSMIVLDRSFFFHQQRPPPHPKLGEKGRFGGFSFRKRSQIRVTSEFDNDNSVYLLKISATTAPSTISGIKNFSATAANLLVAVTKIDNSYYPETLHRMFIVNVGPDFERMLWLAAQKFLDAKTIAKIQVLDPNFLPKLLEVIDASHLHDFLGGACSCVVDGACLHSNKGPTSW